MKYITKLMEGTDRGYVTLDDLTPLHLPNIGVKFY